MMLLNTLMFIMFFGVIGVSLTLMVISDFKMQRINLEGPRALYAAQSGVEYAMRGIMEYAQDKNNNSLWGIHNYTETVPVGGGATVQITITLTGTDSITIVATGQTGGYSQTIIKGFSFENVGSYAIYTTGTVSNVDVIGGPVKQNATVMPIFDLGALRAAAQPLHYFPGSLTISSPFTFVRDVAFIENNLTFNNMNIFSGSRGDFVAGGNITLNSSLISWYYGVMYQPNASAFSALGKPRLYLLDGGLIVNGNVTGVRYKFIFWWFNNMKVLYNRGRILDFMQYTVNGGPLVTTNKSWQRSH